MSRKPDEWMPLHIGDYHADTVHLTRAQHGAYILLLMAYWRRGGPLVATDERLAAITKATPADWRRLKPVMAEFFVDRDGHWHQKRADKELTKALALTEAKASAGKKGAEKRWHNDGKGDGTAMAQPSDSHRQTDAPIPLPSPRPEQEKDSQSEFDSFFAVFPKQEQRDNAEKAYAAAVEAGAKPADLLAGAKRFAAHVEREKIPLKFVALAKTWLKEGHWKDQYEAAPSGEVVLPALHPSWPADQVTRWTKKLGEVAFRTYFGPAEYVEADPVRLCYRSRHLRRLAEEHHPEVRREVALEIAA